MLDDFPSSAAFDEISRALSASDADRKDAVKNGKAIEVPDDTWFLGLGPIAANPVLDDLQEHLAPR